MNMPEIGAGRGAELRRIRPAPLKAGVGGNLRGRFAGLFPKIDNSAVGLTGAPAESDIVNGSSCLWSRS